MRAPAVVALVVASLAAGAAAQDAPPGPSASPGAAAAEGDGALVPARWLVLENPDLRFRRPIAPSAVFERHLLVRGSPPPREGDELRGERGVPVRWTVRETKDGRLDGGDVGWAFTTVESPADRVVLAKVAGAAVAWVNGEPFVGDVYAHGFPGVPVPLRKGTNEIYVSGGRGRIAVALVPTDETLRLGGFDETKPHFTGAAEAEIGQVVVNATRQAVRARVRGDELRVVRLLPCSVAKVPIRGRPLTGAGRDFLTAWVDGDNGHFSSAEVVLSRAEAGAARRVTRVSEIDGSVQEYALAEPAPSLVAAPTRVVLSLHGAGVDCLDQARSYSRRPGFWIVAPTNRRRYGFDWQDWGRRDAYEALAHFGASCGVNVSRVCVTGHSMGGHGTWHLAANDPDRFVAVAPSAGWASFDTYPEGSRPPSALSDVWRRADGTSDTLALVPNLAPLPTFVLHGTMDDNVPAAQAERMLKALREAGGTPSSHFQEGAGHWWDGPAAPGADCVDWPAVFELFAAADPQAAPPASLDWTTIGPAVDAQHHWVGAQIPLVQGRPIRIRAAWDAETGTATVTTENARRISVAPPDGRHLWKLVADGKAFPVGGPRAWLERFDDGWSAVGNVPDERKSALRTGPLKQAFARRFALVLPTRGDEAENREAVARVRFDATLWWYRANGFADVVLDTEVLADPARFELRNLVLYGNADTNAAWAAVVGASPVDVRRGKLRVGEREVASDGAACFFVRPRADDAVGLVAALGDTGARGCRLAMLHAVFSSGTGYPDYLAWDARALKVGDGGVLAAGWFDAEWSLDGRGFLAPELREERR
jgi:dienelactone hydrolase